MTITVLPSAKATAFVRMPASRGSIRSRSWFSSLRITFSGLGRLIPGTPEATPPTSATPKIKSPPWLLAKAVTSASNSRTSSPESVGSWSLNSRVRLSPTLRLTRSSSKASSIASKDPRIIFSGRFRRDDAPCFRRFECANDLVFDGHLVPFSRLFAVCVISFSPSRAAKDEARSGQRV
jgi:hypothetical protein